MPLPFNWWEILSDILHNTIHSVKWQLLGNMQTPWWALADSICKIKFTIQKQKSLHQTPFGKLCIFLKEIQGCNIAMSDGDSNFPLSNWHWPVVHKYCELRNMRLRQFNTLYAGSAQSIGHLIIHLSIVGFFLIPKPLVVATLNLMTHRSTLTWSVNKIYIYWTYHQISNIRCTKSQGLNVSRLILQLSAQCTEARNQVTNEDVVGAVPTG